MANLVEILQWENGIYQLELTDPVKGGADGIDNLQAKQLGNRTLWLRDQVESEATTRASADTTLQSNIDTEATTRAAADTALQDDLTTHGNQTGDTHGVPVGESIEWQSSAQAKADTVQGNLDTEATTRASADSDLQGQINALPTAGKLEGDLVQYGTDLAGNIIIDHPNKSAQVANFGITATVAELNRVADGITATAGEVNKVADGITAYASEINTVADGSTAKNSHTHSTGQNEIEANAVGRSELKTALSQQSQSVSDASGQGVFTVTGGTFSLGWFLGSSINSAHHELTAYPYSGYETKVAVTNSTAGDSTCYFQNRYIQSSPPYDLGDGIVMGFVYVQLDSNGNVLGTYIGEDPPWYGNTRHTPQRQYKAKDGKEYAEFKRSRYGQTGKLEDFGVVETTVEEITTEMKSRGMDELPHPFATDQNIVILDPVDEDLTQRIIVEMLAGGDPVQMFHQGYLRVDNTPKAKRKGPPRVQVHAAKWKNTL